MVLWQLAISSVFISAKKEPIMFSRLNYWFRQPTDLEVAASRRRPRPTSSHAKPPIVERQLDLQEMVPGMAIGYPLRKGHCSRFRMGKLLGLVKKPGRGRYVSLQLSDGNVFRRRYTSTRRFAMAAQ